MGTGQTERIIEKGKEAVHGKTPKEEDLKNAITEAVNSIQPTKETEVFLKLA